MHNNPILLKMTDIEGLLVSVEKKASAMASNLLTLNKKNQDLQNKLMAVLKELEDKEGLINELKEQNEVLTIAKTLNKDTNSHHSYERIDELVKDIDKCLTLLHKQ